MNDEIIAPTQPQQQEVSTTPSLVVYALYLLSILTAGIASLVGLVVAYVFKSDATFIQTHRQYQIRTFWIGFLYSFVCVLTAFIGIGYLLAFAVLVWYIVRCVKGIKLLMEKKAIGNPTTWWV